MRMSPKDFGYFCVLEDDDSHSRLAAMNIELSIDLKSHPLDLPDFAAVIGLGGAALDTVGASLLADLPSPRPTNSHCVRLGLCAHLYTIQVVEPSL